jgi:hypothetical protein
VSYGSKKPKLAVSTVGFLFLALIEKSVLASNIQNIQSGTNLSIKIKSSELKEIFGSSEKIVYI